MNIKIARLNEIKSNAKYASALRGFVCNPCGSACAILFVLLFATETYYKNSNNVDPDRTYLCGWVTLAGLAVLLVSVKNYWKVWQSLLSHVGSEVNEFTPYIEVTDNHIISAIPRTMKCQYDWKALVSVSENSKSFRLVMKYGEINIYKSDLTGVVSIEDLRRYLFEKNPQKSVAT